ncbi:hypothetical protein FBZ84_107290 [Azospirillum baldaniorum]|nr:hypothetical protein FBZ84_107290 [Azospirillum baldaniorum]
MHKGTPYPGDHTATVPQELWDRVQAILKANRVERKNRPLAAGRPLLTGPIVDDRGNIM